MWCADGYDHYPVLTKDCRLELKSEGSRVLGIGSMDQSATIRGKNASYDIRIRTGEYMPIGAKEDNLSFDGGDCLLKINED